MNRTSEGTTSSQRICKEVAEAAISTHLLFDWLKEREENCLRISEDIEGKEGWLEDAAYFHEAAKRVWDSAAILELLAQRDELLAALQGVQIMANCGQFDEFIGEPWLTKVSAAIARVTP